MLLYTFAGTASRWGQRLVVAIGAQMQWHCISADVGAAFLRGLDFEQLSKLTGEPQRRVAFRPPRNYEFLFSEAAKGYDGERHILLMLMPIYGLKDAPRAWKKRLHQALMQIIGCRCLRTDPSLYIIVAPDGKLQAIFSTHVDDLKIAGETITVEKLLKHLTSQFGTLKIQKDVFEHCGILHTHKLKCILHDWYHHAII